MRLSIHRGAKRDLADAAHYYDSQCEGLGDELIEAVQLTFRQLVEVTCAGPQLYRGHRFRMVKRFPYLVIYRVDDEWIRVMAVAHSNRDLAYWHNRIVD